ncbi:MAG: murein biosynthesis integral membrane protein MurJ [Nitrospira sp. NTP2]|nr:murein biosynthesis integral membrane protein MurJ [Nitrospira sp. NTP2]RIK61301.1 MAG: murein biosynthesis integral membrane protein MurJ [Nitrospira sp.]
MSEPTASAETSRQTPNENHSVVKAAGLIGVATFSSRILGFVRDMVLARLFGATPAADAFFVAYRIPNLLRELFAEGSMSAAFIPVFTEYQTLKTKRDAWELASATFTTLLTIVTAVTMLGIAAAPAIVWLLAPGFHASPDKLALTSLLTRVMFPYLLFVSLAALAMGILNSLRAFAAPAFSPVFFNICTIACALVLSPLLAEPIVGVAIGIVAGGAAQFLMQLPGLRGRGMLFGFRFNPGHPGVKRIGRLMIPSLLGLSVTQINITVSTILASFFAGGPTYLFYGMRLIQFPLGIFGVALATAILPTLSAQAARGALDELRATLGFGLRMIFFIILPAMLGLILLRQPIVHLFFEHGSFTSGDTQATATAVLCYAAGLWAFAGVRIIVSAFYSLQDTKTPAVTAGIAVVANILLSVWLMTWLQAAGLALATALASMLNGSILVAVLHRRLGSVDWATIGRSALRVLAASVPLVAICLWVAESAVWSAPGAWVAKTAVLAGGIGASVFGYLGLHIWMGSEELDVVLGMVKRKFGRLTRRVGGN